MPRKRKQVNYGEESEEEESEWEANDENAEDESDDSAIVEDDDDDSVVEKRPPPPKKKKAPPKPKPPAAKKPVAKKPRSAAPRKKKNLSGEIIYNDEEDEEEHLSSTARKTVKGGYSHTNKSRLKISKANRGNVPWNKGKNRSQSAKAKIAAGVRARNRAVLLKKLEQLGLTEDEWNTKTKQIKILRERLRRTRKANREKGALLKSQKRKEEQKLMQEDDPEELPEGDANFLEQIKAEVAAELESGKKVEDESKNAKGGITCASGNGESPQESSKEADSGVASKKREKEVSDADEEDDDDSSSDEEPPVHPMLSIFAPDIHWTPHPFSADRNRKEAPVASYKDVCPNGGPGGLICCAVCTATYSKYLSATSKDMEQQRNSKVAEEMEQLMGFVKESKARLATSVRAARKKNPPVNRKRAAITLDGDAPIVVPLPKKPTGSIALRK